MAIKVTRRIIKQKRVGVCGGNKKKNLDEKLSLSLSLSLSLFFSLFKILIQDDTLKIFCL